MSDITYDKFMHYGTDAQRLAFVPAPAATIQPLYVWYATDTDLVWLYTTAWKGPFSSGGSSGGTALSILTTISAAQVKALFTTPIDLVVAPGAGKINVVDRITFASTFNTTAYAGANNLEFRYTNAAGAKVTADMAAATLNFAAGVKYSTVAGVVTELLPVVNSKIVVCVPVANPTLGDSIVKIRTDYKVFTLP
jgi:hypothetical protein